MKFRKSMRARKQRKSSRKQRKGTTRKQRGGGHCQYGSFCDSSPDGTHRWGKEWHRLISSDDYSGKCRYDKKCFNCNCTETGEYPAFNNGSFWDEKKKKYTISWGCVPNQW